MLQEELSGMIKNGHESLKVKTMYKVNISELKELKNALIRSNDLLARLCKNPMVHSNRREIKLIIKENEIQIKELSTKFYIE